MKSISKTFGGIILILGVIGSILVAIFFGKAMNYHILELERDWRMTLLLFLSCALPSIVLSIILYALSEILERQEIIFKALNISMESNDKRTSISYDNAANVNATHSDLETHNTTMNMNISKSSWKCPTCGHINDISQSSCSLCKLTRPSSTL